jgi:hypothetical protein
MAKRNSFTIRGKAHWAKVLGEPVNNYAGDGREWTLDLTPDEKGVELLKELGIDSRLKNKDDERGDFIAFRQREKRMDGSLNKRISVSDKSGEPWPQDKLIGNGSVVDLKFNFKDYGKGKYPGVYPQAIRVLEYVPYQAVEFAPLDEDDPYAEKNDMEGALPEGMEPEVEEEFPE